MRQHCASCGHLIENEYDEDGNLLRDEFCDSCMKDGSFLRSDLPKPRP